MFSRRSVFKLFAATLAFISGRRPGDAIPAALSPPDVAKADWEIPSHWGPPGDAYNSPPSNPVLESAIFAEATDDIDLDAELMRQIRGGGGLAPAVPPNYIPDSIKKATAEGDLLPEDMDEGFCLVSDRSQW